MCSAAGRPRNGKREPLRPCNRVCSGPLQHSVRRGFTTTIGLAGKKCSAGSNKDASCSPFGQPAHMARRVRAGGGSAHDVTCHKPQPSRDVQLDRRSDRRSGTISTDREHHKPTNRKLPLRPMLMARRVRVGGGLAHDVTCRHEPGSASHPKPTATNRQDRLPANQRDKPGRTTPD